MEIIQNENCSTCENVVPGRGETICEVFNISVEIYKDNAFNNSRLKTGDCNSGLPIKGSTIRCCLEKFVCCKQALFSLVC